MGGGALWYFHGRENFYEFSHSTAAMAMFAFLAAAAFFNGWDADRCRVPRYPTIYYLVAGLMAATAGLFLTSLDHKVLWIEGIEIGLFATLWIVQTKELWAETLRRRPAGG
jgi:predicted Kef-type K+ transport protein